MSEEKKDSGEKEESAKRCNFGSYSSEELMVV